MPAELVSTGAIATGVIVGAVSVLVAATVWFRKQEFGVAGTILSLVGCVLIGLSIWGRVSFEVGSVRAEFDRLAEQLDLTSRGVLELAQRVEISQESVVQLASAVEQSSSADVEVASVDRLSFLAAHEPVPIRELMTLPDVAWDASAVERQWLEDLAGEVAPVDERWSTEMMEFEAAIDRVATESGLEDPGMTDLGLEPPL